jgi:hypothetical protein
MFFFHTAHHSQPPLQIDRHFDLFWKYVTWSLFPLRGIVYSIHLIYQYWSIGVFKSRHILLHKYVNRIMITYLWHQIQLIIPSHCFRSIECRHFDLFWKYVTWSLFPLRGIVFSIHLIYRNWSILFFLPNRRELHLHLNVVPIAAGVFKSRHILLHKYVNRIMITYLWRQIQLIIPSSRFRSIECP